MQLKFFTLVTQGKLIGKLYIAAYNLLVEAILHNPANRLNLF